MKKPATQTQSGATLLILTGLCCGLVPLCFYFKGYFTQRTTVDRLLLIDYHESLLISLGVILIYLGIAWAKRFSGTWYFGYLCFSAIALPTVFISAANFLITICCAGLLFLGLFNIPRQRSDRCFNVIYAIVIGVAFTPNIQWASIRAEESRAKSNLRCIAFALEAYQADYKAPLPTDFDLIALTTPIAYMSGLPLDPFRNKDEHRSFRYHRWDDRSCILISAGPNCVFDISPDSLPELRPTSSGSFPGKLINLQYDPTNGTVSAGDIFRIQFAEGTKK